MLCRKLSRMSKKITLLVLTLVIVFGAILAVFSEEAHAMFWPFKRYDVEMSPPVAGRLTDGGKPVVGVMITRAIFYQGYKDGKGQITTTFTDDTGRFEFDEMTIRSRYPGDIFGQNFPVSQNIYVGEPEKGDVHLLWAASKGVKSLPTLSRLMADLESDLDNPDYLYEIDTSDDGGRSFQVVDSTYFWQGDKMILTRVKNSATGEYEELTHTEEQ
ncbi:hypothetical protein PBPRA1069 [Photobacterium profundum SS9]|uniref:DUF6795 domain-containing protein n=2 Tax=Photobacterium profundum TaxID=74109 RepID=Q6LT96_PHOPR|nr:hypothetical protein PBPRA1069 [Photobacterium profundum SS9]